MNPLIEVHNLRFRYSDGTEALAGVDFRLDAGETVALLGANGSGKTTFVLHLAGLLHGEGEVRVCGIPVGKKTAEVVRRKIGIVFQDSDEQLFMPTVLEDVTYGLLNLGMEPGEAIVEARRALDTVGMGGCDAKAPYHLSAGEKRRVALAGILVMRPEILILDEPMTFLDPPGRRDLIGLLRRFSQAKLLATHEAEVARAIATRAVFFEKGKIIADGPVEEILRQFNWDVCAANTNG